MLHIYDSISGPHLRRITSAARVYILSRPGARNSCGSMLASALTSTGRRRQTASTAGAQVNVYNRWDGGDPLPACRPSGCPTTGVTPSPHPSSPVLLRSPIFKHSNPLGADCTQLQGAECATKEHGWQRHFNY